MAHETDWLFERLKRIPDDIQPGEKREVECVCGGKMVTGRSSYNGHLFARCENCGFWMRE